MEMELFLYDADMEECILEKNIEKNSEKKK